MKTLTVKRGFVFSHAMAGARVPHERRIPAGTHHFEDDDPILHSDWITQHFADGAIETPDETKTRTDARMAELKAQTDDASRQNAAARAAFARTQRLAKGNASNDLNTPIDQLAAGKDGSDINTPVNQLQHRDMPEIQMTDALREELNTPVNVLQARQGAQQNEEFNSGEGDETTDESTGDEESENEPEKPKKKSRK